MSDRWWKEVGRATQSPLYPTELCLLLLTPFSDGLLYSFQLGRKATDTLCVRGAENHAMGFWFPRSVCFPDPYATVARSVPREGNFDESIFQD